MNQDKPLRADARRNRDALIAAAREIFAAEGTEVPFEDFARRAGVGAGTLYRHFPTRDALAAAVYRAEVSALCDRARDLSEAHAPREALALFLREMVDHMYTHRGLGRTFAAFAEAAGGAIAGEGVELEDAVSALLERGIQAGDIRDDVSTGALMLALHGIAFASTRSASRTEADAVIQLLVDGLGRP
ncbi:TetR/AcrR family transcriptional regulator [Demequina sp. TMPB413]|uniref:TetR/AcrR family transcriptional regulator n=1 Tax=Demequina sp. TMPB413 TaxID=2881056 RepID=UPI001CF3FC42|nr:TetR/AcrR family transcriptional regulator [Demequina sp. TMPB413]UPU87315.1 TetR/AcrR family transcriptional regulator [Demequina sp. TMPB413]